MQRIVSFLNDVLDVGLPARGLAVVPVDDADAAALCVVTLALTWAREGKSVVLADLCPDRPAARLLRVRGAGIHTAGVDGADLTVIVPEAGTIAPLGPFGLPSGDGRRVAAPELIDACASADLVVVLASVDPSTGSDHLGTWAVDAVVSVTAGRASWTRIHAVGELVRLAGIRLISAFLLSADTSDESLGLPLQAPESDGGVAKEVASERGPAHARLLPRPVNGSSLPSPSLDAVEDYS